MKLSIRVYAAGAEIHESLCQMEDRFNNVLAQQEAPTLKIEGVAALEFSPATSHPVHGKRDKARASLDRAKPLYRIHTPVPYVAWASTDWNVRVRVFQDALSAGIDALPKSRFTDSDKATLRAAIERAALTARASPPKRSTPVKPIFVFTDADGRPRSISYRVDDETNPRPKVGFEIAPEDAGKHEGLWAKSEAAPDTEMFKLYHRISKTELHYREAWFAEDVVVEHWGRCGERGEVRNHPAPSKADAARILAQLKKEGRDAGYRPIPDSRMTFLVVEYALDTWGTPDDLDRRHKLEDEFNELIGWLGLGHLDGGSIGSGSMEVALLVVDYNIAKVALERETKGTELAGFTRIGRS